MRLLHLLLWQLVHESYAIRLSDDAALSSDARVGVSQSAASTSADSGSKPHHAAKKPKQTKDAAAQKSQASALCAGNAQIQAAQQELADALAAAMSGQSSGSTTTPLPRPSKEALAAEKMAEATLSKAKRESERLGAGASNAMLQVEAQKKAAKAADDALKKAEAAAKATKEAGEALEYLAGSKAEVAELAKAGEEEALRVEQEQMRQEEKQMQAMYERELKATEDREDEEAESKLQADREAKAKQERLAQAKVNKQRRDAFEKRKKDAIALSDKIIEQEMKAELEKTNAFGGSDKAEAKGSLLQQAQGELAAEKAGGKQVPEELSDQEAGATTDGGKVRIGEKPHVGAIDKAEDMTVTKQQNAVATQRRGAALGNVSTVTVAQ